HHPLTDPRQFGITCNPALGWQRSDAIRSKMVSHLGGGERIMRSDVRALRRPLMKTVGPLLTVALGVVACLLVLLVMVRGSYAADKTHLAREGRMTVTIGRRELLAALGGAAAAWPLAARAQRPSIPAIGFLDATTAADTVYRVSAFRDGLKEAGFIDGPNVAIEFPWAENKLDRLPALAADLAQRQVAVIVGPNIAMRVVRTATSTIPIVFVSGGDPIATGLVTNLSRPGGNITGVSYGSVPLQP